jgi:hypothetical protein
MGKRVGRRVPISDQRQGLTAQQSINFRRPALNFQHPARVCATAIARGVASRQAPRRLEAFMTRDPRCALSEELLRLGFLTWRAPQAGGGSRLVRRLSLMLSTMPDNGARQLSALSAHWTDRGS